MRGNDHGMAGEQGAVDKGLTTCDHQNMNEIRFDSDIVYDFLQIRDLAAEHGLSVRFRENPCRFVVHLQDDPSQEFLMTHDVRELRGYINGWVLAQKIQNTIKTPKTPKTKSNGYRISCGLRHLVTLDKEQYQTIKALIDNDETILAIKFLRNTLIGIGLKEAKDAVENPENWQRSA